MARRQNHGTKSTQTDKFTRRNVWNTEKWKMAQVIFKHNKLVTYKAMA